MEDLRNNINYLDKKMAQLFNERLKVVEKIKIYKQEHNIPIIDEEREKALLEENLKQVDKQYQSLYETFFQTILAISKALQK